MSINFNADRWEQVKETYAKWWNGTLGRPIIPVELIDQSAAAEKTDIPLLNQQTCTYLSIPPEDIINRIDDELSSRVYFGDAFPYFNFDCFGPGVMAAFCGAVLDNSSGRVWFHPPEHLKEARISDIHLEYDPNNIWLNRIKDIYAAGIKKWRGQVLMSMPDLGGNLDVLCSFRTTQQLLFDLYDDPNEVKRLLWEVHQLWHRFYNELNEILQPTNPGYSDWSSIYSDKPSYIFQCDFSFMLGPDMFEEFALPELKSSCEKLGRSFYHLDGSGQLSHLDFLCSIEELGGIQWVPGEGKPGCDQWPEVYKKIHAANKKIQIVGGEFSVIDAIAGQIGTAEGIQHNLIRKNLSEEPDIRKKLSQYGIE